MTTRRLLIHTVFLFLLPLIVAWFGISVVGAVFLTAIALLWRWMISISGVIAPEKVPDLELETISASHFVEKVRWCMDRLGIVYTERPMAGVFGAFFTGRSVPLLRIKTGRVQSRIGNSPEILRYLWGQYSAVPGEKADFLRPTPERLELEKKLGRYGVNLQVWVYYHILDYPKLTQRAWGCDSPDIPVWQQYLVVAIFPLLRGFIRKSFGITDSNYRKSVEHIESLLKEIDVLLADDRASILGDEVINYVDITFASLSSLWLQPAEFAGGKSEYVRIDPQDVPAAMQADMDRWLNTYAMASGFMQRLYEQER